MRKWFILILIICCFSFLLSCQSNKNKTPSFDDYTSEESGIIKEAHKIIIEENS